MSKATSVEYAVHEKHYVVTVFDEEGTIEEYRTTNNPLDSQGPEVSVGQGISQAQMRDWAIEAAIELAFDHGLSEDDVSEVAPESLY